MIVYVLYNFFARDCCIKKNKSIWTPFSTFIVNWIFVAIYTIMFWIIILNMDGIHFGIWINRLCCMGVFDKRKISSFFLSVLEFQWNYNVSL